MNILKQNLNSLIPLAILSTLITLIIVGFIGIVVLLLSLSKNIPIIDKITIITSS